MNFSPPGWIHGDSPSKNTGVGCHARLQGIFPTPESNWGLLHRRQILYHLSHQESPCSLDEQSPKKTTEVLIFTSNKWKLCWQRICLKCRRPGFNPWVRKTPWRRAWPPTPAFLPGDSHGQRNLVDYGRKELVMTEQLTHTQQSTEGKTISHLYKGRLHEYRWES